MKKSMFLISMAAIALSGCTKVQVTDVEGSWEISEFVKGETAQQIAESDITFVKESGTNFTVNGSSGVNLFTGSVSVADGKITVSDNMASTKMAGSPEAEAFENEFLAVLTAADKVEVTEADGVKLLKLTDSETNSTLTFAKKAEAPAAE